MINSINNPREKLLEVAFDEIYHNGYNGTSIDKILKKASMNKGSMYHFFKSKKELALVVIEEKLNEHIVASIEGCLGTAKKSQDGNCFESCISQLELFLKSLKK